MGLTGERKDSELGPVPEDWDVKQLGDFASVRGGKRLPLGSGVTDKVTPHPYLRVTDMRPGGVDLSDIRYVPVEVAPAIRNYRIFESDLFISVAGSLGIVGRIPAVLDGANLTENADRITDINCDRDFLLHNLMAPRIQRVITGERTVGAQPKLALGRIERFLVALPPTREEQQAIAAALSDVDALIGSLDQLIAKKRDLKQAAMQRLLTGQTRLPGFSGKWEHASLSSLLTMRATYGIVTSGSFQRDGVPMVRGGDIKDGRIEGDLPFVTAAKSREYARTVLKAGDVVVALVGYPGEAARVPEHLHGANISRAVGLLRTDASAIAADYLVCYLNTSFGRRMVLAPSAGSAQLVVNLSALNKLNFPLPKIEEQLVIAAMFGDVDAEITALEARRDKTKLLKVGMMQELLTGRTRLV
jgi:type I restriction enzyme S subunit